MNEVYIEYIFFGRDQSTPISRYSDEIMIQLNVPLKNSQFKLLTVVKTFDTVELILNRVPNFQFEESHLLIKRIIPIKCLFIMKNSSSIFRRPLSNIYSLGKQLHFYSFKNSSVCKIYCWNDKHAPYKLKTNSGGRELVFEPIARIIFQRGKTDRPVKMDIL